MNPASFDLIDGLPHYKLFINGSWEHRLPHSLNMSFLYVEGESLLMGINDIAVSSGSACLVGSVQPSHVLAAMGLAGEGATVRFSIGAHIGDGDLEEIITRVASVVQHQRALRAHVAEGPA